MWGRLSENLQDVAYPELKDTNFIANTTTLSFWVRSSGTGNIVWAKYSQNYPYYNRVLEIKTYTKYRITAREQPTVIALLQDNVPVEGKVASDWNNGNIVVIPAGGVYEVDSDKYPYLSARFGGSRGEILGFYLPCAVVEYFLHHLNIFSISLNPNRCIYRQVVT